MYLKKKKQSILTNKIESFELAEKLINDATLGLELNRNIAKNVWIYYFEKNDAIVKTNYEPIGTVAKLLNVQHITINNHLDKWIKGGINGNYVFTYELDNLVAGCARIPVSQYPSIPVSLYPSIPYQIVITGLGIRD